MHSRWVDGVRISYVLKWWTDSLITPHGHPLCLVFICEIFFLCIKQLSNVTNFAHICLFSSTTICLLFKCSFVFLEFAINLFTFHGNFEWFEFQFSCTSFQFLSTSNPFSTSILQDLVHILLGAASDDPLSYVQSALSDLHRLFGAAKKQLAKGLPINSYFVFVNGQLDGPNTSMFCH